MTGPFTPGQSTGVEVRVYASAVPPDNYARLFLRNTEEVEALLSHMAAYGVEFEGGLYQERDVSGAWCLDDSGIYFAITVDTPADEPTDLR